MTTYIRSSPDLRSASPIHLGFCWKLVGWLLTLAALSLYLYVILFHPFTFTLTRTVVPLDLIFGQASVRSDARIVEAEQGKSTPVRNLHTFRWFASGAPHSSPVYCISSCIAAMRGKPCSCSCRGIVCRKLASCKTYLLQPDLWSSLLFRWPWCISASSTRGMRISKELSARSGTTL